MKNTVEIDTDQPETLDKILTPSLQTRGKVKINTQIEEDSFKVEVETDGLGPLRGTTDNIYRLTSLAQKITTR